jgi:hypothetical protein
MSTNLLRRASLWAALALVTSPAVLAQSTFTYTAAGIRIEDFALAPAGSFDPSTRIATPTWNLSIASPTSTPGVWWLNGLDCDKLANGCIQAVSFTVVRTGGQIMVSPEHPQVKHSRYRITTPTGQDVEITNSATFTFQVFAQRWSVVLN